MFSTQTDAKRFFIEKITAQAQAEGKPLSDVQQWMLSFSESDPEFTVDPSRMAEFQQETNDSAYEERVAGLPRRSYERDLEDDPQSQGAYREAQTVLATGDHYLLIMANQAIGRPSSRRLAAKGPMRVVRIAALFGVLVLPGTLALLLAAALAWGFATHRPFEAEQAIYPLIAMVTLGGGGAYMIRIWIREWRK